MNWIWDIRSRDGGMNGLEFARCTTAGGFTKVLVHAAPARMSVEIRTDTGEIVAQADLDRDEDYSPMTELVRDDTVLRRAEIWPDEEHRGVPVLLAGGEVGLLHAWQHAEDRTWWRWSVEFSNHTGRPADWAPPGQRVRR
jgi:hypothetical protein